MRGAGFYVAGVYREKASGGEGRQARVLRMIADLPEEIMVAEKIDRISRLPLPEAEQLIAAIRAKGARLAVPGVIDLSELAAEAFDVAKIVLEAVHDMLLKLDARRRGAATPIAHANLLVGLAQIADSVLAACTSSRSFLFACASSPVVP